MKSRDEKHSGRLLTIGILVGIIALTAGPALAALTFSSTTIVGGSSISIDSSSTIAIGTSTASGVVIGNASATVSIFGNIQQAVTSSILAADANGRIIATTTSGAALDSTGHLTPSQAPFTTPTLITNNLLAQYPMTNCNGTAISGTSTVPDCSGNANNGTAAGSPAFDATGMTLGGSNYVTLPAVVASNTVTALVFGDFDESVMNGTYDAVLGQAVNTNKNELFASYDLVTPSPGIFTSSAGFITASAQALTRRASMVGATFDTTADTLYVDGQPVSGYTGSNSPVRGGSLGSRGGQWNIGARTFSGTSFAIHGKIYYALFYSGALTNAQVAQDYNAVRNIIAQRGDTVYVRNATVI